VLVLLVGMKVSLLQSLLLVSVRLRIRLRNPPWWSETSICTAAGAFGEMGESHGRLIRRTTWQGNGLGVSSCWLWGNQAVLEVGWSVSGCAPGRAGVAVRDSVSVSGFASVGVGQGFGTRWSWLDGRRGARKGTFFSVMKWHFGVEVR
jgi:hypothetical protein